MEGPLSRAGLHRDDAPVVGGAERAAWAVTVPPGYRVGVWEVTDGIATGSWGSVYAARQIPVGQGPNIRAQGLPEEAALKFLPTGTLGPRQVRHLAEMIEREARARTQLQHPRLVRTHEMLTVDDPGCPLLDGAVVLVMERAVGTLRHVLDQNPGRPVPDATRLIAETGDGLAYMHALGWIHGDLKPSNILVMADGSIRLADFGLAAELDGTHCYLPPAGSSDYLPPEARAEMLTERGRPVRTSTDVWAFGIVACQLLTGMLPFPGTTPRARAAAAADYAANGTPLPGLAALPQEWREIIADCLAPDHARRRHHDVASLAQRVRALGALPVSHAPRPRVVALLVAGAVALTVAATAIAVRNSSVDVPVSSPPATASEAADTAFGNQWLRPDVGIPAQYRQLVVTAGTSCNEVGLSPALIAAILKVQSNFDPDLSDPAMDEFGIARWTPRVLRYHLPPDQRAEIPTPPFPPEMSIPAVARYICRYLPELTAVPGDRGLLIAAGFEFNSERVLQVKGVPPEASAFVERINYYRSLYDPQLPRPTAPPP